MKYHALLNTIFKMVSLALSVASFVLLIVNFGDSRTILTLLSISVVCNAFAGLSNNKKLQA